MPHFYLTRRDWLQNGLALVTASAMARLSAPRHVARLAGPPGVGIAASYERPRRRAKTASPGRERSTGTDRGESSVVEALRAHVRTLAGEIGERNIFRPAALRAAADFIAARWQAQGYSVAAETYTVDGMACSNLEVTRRGTRTPNEIIVVGAHYDSVAGSPGADDNASGVAALLEMSRWFSGEAPACTLRFVAFVNEEPPLFSTRGMGSDVYARAAHARGDDIWLMMSLETIGYHRQEPGTQRYPPLFGRFRPDRGNFIAFVANLASRHRLRQAMEAFRASSDFPVETLATFGLVPGVAWSDHLSFWRQGYRALMVTDTAFYRYPHYHAPEDTPDKLTYDALACVTVGLCRAVAALASAEP